MKTITLEISDKLYATLNTRKMVSALCSDVTTSIEGEIISKIIKAIREDAGVCELKYKSEGEDK